MQSIETLETEIGVPAKKEKNLKGILLTLVKIVISAALIYFILSKTNLPEIWKAVQQASLTLLLLSFSLHVIGFIVSAFRWQVLLKAQGIKMGIPYLIESFSVSVFFNNLLPSTIGGDTIRAYDIWKKGYSKTESITVILVDRFLGLFALIVFAAVAIFFSPEINRRIPNLQLWVLGTFVLMAIAIVAIFLHEKRVKQIGTIFDLPGLKLVKKKLSKIADAFKSFRGKNSALAWGLFWSFVLQVNVILHYYLINEALHMHVPLMQFFLIIPIATFIMMIPVSINAIGLRENTYVFFFSPFAVPIALSVAFSWVAYGMILVLGILGGIVYAIRK